MKQAELIQSNKLIAEFMGSDYTKRQIPDWAFRLFNFDTMGYGGYLYHTSWDWLMPVVEKIERSICVDGRGEVNFVVTIEPGYCVISQGGEDIISEYQGDDPKIIIVYKAVVQFITWYNRQL